MRPLPGILLMISAVTLFTVMTAFIKAAENIPPGQAVFFRAGIGLPLILGWLWLRGEVKGGLRTTRPAGHAMRAIAGSMAMGLGFAGLHYLPLPEVTAIRFVTPVIMVVLAALLLGERIRLIRLTAVALGLVGVLIILAPRLDPSAERLALFGALLTLGSAGLAAVAQIAVKSMAGKESTAAIVFYFSLTATTLSLFTIPFGWVWPSPAEWAFLIGAGVVGGIGQILLTSGYRFADASVLAPFTYVSMLWALVIGYFVFAEVPTLQMLGGAALIIAAGVAIVLRERALGLRATAQRKLENTGYGKG